MDRIHKKIRTFSQLERKLLFFVVILTVVGFVLFVCLLAVKKDRPVCYTQNCIRAAHHVISSIDESVDPCKDFYKFACGSFLKVAIAKNLYSTLKPLEDMKDNHVRQIVIEDMENEDHLTKGFRYQRKFYRMCMNTTAIEEDKDTAFLKALKDVTGGWPLSQGITEDLYWPEVMVRARERGLQFNFFLDVDIRYCANQSSWYLEISPPPKLNFDENLWQDENLRRIIEMAEYWGDPTPSASWEARRTIEFARNLSELVDKTHNDIKDIPEDQKNTTIGNLKRQQFLKLNWLQFLKNITGLQHLKEHDTVFFNVGDNYFKNLYYLLLKTKTKFWVNYIALLFISQQCDYLSTKIEAICKKIRRPSQYTRRRDFCFDQSERFFEGIAAAYYIRKVTTEDKRQHIRKIIKNVKKELELKLIINKWMDEETKKLAVKRLNNVTEAIGWIDFVFDDVEYEKRFGFDKLELRSDNIIEAIQQLNKFQLDYHFKKIGTNLSNYWKRVSIPYLHVNAYYIKYLNVFIASLLHPPIYDLNWPGYMNYGSLGSIIGHELTHVFSKSDEPWLLFGKDEGDFWTNQTHENYEIEKNCVIEEYENYTEKIEGKAGNGSLTLNENLADFTGVNLAYLAYQKWVDRYGTEDQLPGLKYTPNQLFWIMASTFNCMEPKLKDPDKEHSEKIHSDSSFRVIGPIRNSPYFGNDFGCPVESEMNPKKKCRLFV